MSDVERLVSDCRKQLGESATAEDMIAFLRSASQSKVGSMRALKRLLGISLTEAQRLVHFSDVWKDRREADEKFQDQFFDELEKL